MDYMFDDDRHMGLDDEQDEITQEEAWTVIDAYFEEKGLVRQQLDSFYEFVDLTMQEIVDEAIPIVIEMDVPGQSMDYKRKYEIKFEQIYITRPMMKEGDKTEDYMYPRQARLRNLTYASDMFVDLTCTVREGDLVEQRKYEQQSVGKLPIMLRSKFCNLSHLKDSELPMVGECPYDQGGYFIINGSEKVLVAQEKMSLNHVYIFSTKDGKYSTIAECRSSPQSSFRPTSTMFVKILKSGKMGTGPTIQAEIPYVKKDVPMAIIFRALGFVADRNILEHVCYDLHDRTLMEMLRPSLEETLPIQDQEMALDWIGKRGSAVGVPKADRITYAMELLQKEMLPHVGTERHCETKKAYFFGYIIHKLLMSELERIPMDDRDHYGNKRLDLAGPLLATLFRQLFKKLSKEVRMYAQKTLDDERRRGSEERLPDLQWAIKPHTIANGFKYALATGNWGADRAKTKRAGVSQVLNRLTFASTLSHLRRLNSPIGREVYPFSESSPLQRLLQEMSFSFLACGRCTQRMFRDSGFSRILVELLYQKNLLQTWI